MKLGARDQKKVETSARLIAAARKSFFELGYAQTSMDELCAEAGVTRGALYHNFGGKEGLFEAVVIQIDAEIGKRLLESAEENVTLKGFIRTCVAYLQLALEPEVQQIMFKDGPAVLGQRLRQIDQEGSIEPLHSAIEELQDKGLFPSADPTALAVLINGAMIDAALWIADKEDGEDRFKTSANALTVLIERLALTCKDSH